VAVMCWRQLGRPVAWTEQRLDGIMNAKGIPHKLLCGTRITRMTGDVDAHGRPVSVRWGLGNRERLTKGGLGDE